MKQALAWLLGMCVFGLVWFVAPGTSNAGRFSPSTFSKNVKTSSPALSKALNEALKHPRFRRELLVQRRKFWTYTRVNLARRGLFQGMIHNTMRYYKLPLELIMVAGAESSYKARVLSRSGATGVWQFIPRTGRRYGLRMTPWLDERRHVQKATIAAARYLKFLYNRYKRWDLAIASYNCGERMMDRSLRRCPSHSIWSMIGKSRCRVPKQTANYIARIFSLIYYMHNPQHFRRPIRIRKSLVLHKVWAPGPVSLPDFAKAVGISLKRLWRDNSELSAWATPPGRPYPLLLPAKYVRRARQYLGSLHRLPYKLVSVPVNTSSSLAGIAGKYGLRTDDLRLLNRLPSYSIPRYVNYLLVPMPRTGKEWSLLQQGTLVGLVQNANHFMRTHILARPAHDAKWRLRPQVPWCVNCVASANVNTKNLIATDFTQPTYRPLLRSARFKGIRYQTTLDWTRIVIHLGGEVRLEQGKVPAAPQMGLPKRFFIDITPCKPGNWWYKAGFTLGGRHVRRLRVGRTNNTTRIVLELLQQKNVRVTVLSNPVRIVMDVAKNTMPLRPTNKTVLPRRQPTRLVGNALRRWKRRFGRRR